MLLLLRKEGIDATNAENNLDAIVATTSDPSWPINGDHLEEEVHRLLPGRAILISRYRQDMCLGGRNFPVQYCLPEPSLIAMAYALGQALQVHIEPALLKTLELV